MKIAAVCLFLFIGLARGGLLPSGATFVRAPAHDSAVIKSNRLGGNFAYSTLEGHAYAALTPVVERIAEPYAVSYDARPVHLGYAAAPLAGVIAHAPAAPAIPQIQQTPAQQQPDDSVSVEATQ